MKPNKLASEIVGSELANALRHSPGFMVGSLVETKRIMRREGTLHVKAFVAAFLNSMRIDDELAKQYPTWLRLPENPGLSAINRPSDPGNAMPSFQRTAGDAPIAQGILDPGERRRAYLDQ